METMWINVSHVRLQLLATEQCQTYVQVPRGTYPLFPSFKPVFFPLFLNNQMHSIYSAKKGINSVDKYTEFTQVLFFCCKFEKSWYHSLGFEVSTTAPPTKCLALPKQGVTSC